MNTLNYKGYEGSVEVDTERNVCRGKLLFISDLVTYEASSPSALKIEFESAVDDYIQTCAELGREPLRPFKGSFNVRVGPERHRAAVVCATREGVSLNDVVTRALDCYCESAGVRHHEAHYHFVLTGGRGEQVASVVTSESAQAEWVGAQTGAVSYAS